MATNSMGLKINLNLDTTQGTKTFNDWSNKVQAQLQNKPIKLNFEIDGQKYEKQIETFIGKNHELVEITTFTNKATKEQFSQVTNLADGFDRLQQAANGQVNTTHKLAQAQNNLNTHVQKSNSLFKDFVDTFGKMVKFNTINMIYDGIVKSLTECVEITNKFNSAMIEFKKVTDTSNLSMQNYLDTLDKLGQTVGFSRTEMLEAATEFSKGGYDAETAAQLARISSLYRNIADEELSAGDAASYVISQLKAFNMESDNVAETTQNALSIIDKTNEVSNNFAVSSANVATALTKQSASLATYGNDINEVIGLVTASTEILTNNASKAARGIKTIGANIAQMAQAADSFKITAGGIEKTIQLIDSQSGDMLSTYDVLRQVAESWEDMSKAEKTSLAITMAGKNQIDVFTSTMNNFNSAIKAKTVALLADGSAEKENQAAMSGLEKQTKALRAEYENFILSLPIEEIEVSVLSLSKTLLKFFNSDLVQGIIKIAAITAAGLAILSVLTKLNNFLVNIPSLLWSTVSALTGVDASIMATNGLLTNTNLILTAMKTLVLTNPLFIAGAIVAAIATAVVVFEKLNVTFEEANENLRQINQEISNTESAIKTTTEKLSDIKQQLEDINNLKLDITNDEELKTLNKQYDALVRQSAELRNQLALEQGKLASQKEQQKIEADRLKNKSVSATIYNTPNGATENGEQPTAFSTTGKADVVGQKLIEGLKATQAEIDRCEQAMSQYTDTTDKGYIQLQQEQESYRQEWIEMNNQMTDEILPACDNIIQAGQDIDSTYQAVYDGYYEFMEKSQGKDFSLISEDDIEAVEEQGNIWDEYLEHIEDIQSAYETLTKAVDEYNKNGYISASTLKKLNKLSPEHLALLAQEGDKYENIKKGLEGYLDDEKADALLKVELARQIAIVEACQNRLADASSDAKDEIKNVGDTSEEVTPKMAELARTTTQAAIGMMAVKNAGKMDEDFKAQLDDINSYFDGLAESINNVSLGAADSSKSAAGSTKDAWVEAFEEEQRLLKHALEMNEITEIEYYQKLKDLNEKYFGEISGNHQKYIKEYQENEEEIYKGMKAIYDRVADYLAEAIEQGYEDAINALKKEEKKVLAEIKAQIEALKDEKKKVLDDIQNQIDGLKKKKDKVQDYWNSQIDKIKESNSELQKQNELLEKQQALQRAKAQKVMVMKDGKFQLGENESAVAQAEQNLAQYQDQMSYEQQISEMEKLRDAQVETIDDRIEKLEEYKDYMEDYYDEQIDALEKYYDQVEKQYEEQIEALQEQLDAFKKHAEEQKKIEEARLAAQLLGIEKESDLFEISLANLEDYVAKYNALVASMEVPSVFADGLGNIPIGGSAPSGGGVGKGTTITKAASGASSIGSDEVVLVGESPNAELVVGSHLNRSMGGGTLLNLSKGSGVVNAESTATLAGLLNGVVTPTNVSNSRSTMQTFTFGNLTLPNVTDAESFVNTLSHKFNNYAIQYGNSRK